MCDSWNSKSSGGRNETVLDCGIGASGWGFVSGTFGNRSTTPETPAKIDPKAPPRYSPYVVQEAVRRQLRDPDSAVFGEMYAVGDRLIYHGSHSGGVVCGTVNSKNGFGGYAGATPYIVFVPKYLVTIGSNKDASFVKLWNQACRS